MTMSEGLILAHRARRKMARDPLAILMRYWSKVNVGSNSECWEWVGNKNACLYGMFSCVRGVPKYKSEIGAHRFIYQVYNGRIKKGYNICHRCDNPSCVNPKHLFQATQNENIQDCKLKGRTRSAPGESSPLAKLKWDQVVEIRNKYIPREYPSTKLAKEYSVSRSLILGIIHKRLWKKKC